MNLQDLCETLLKENMRPELRVNLPTVCTLRPHVIQAFAQHNIRLKIPRKGKSNLLTSLLENNTLKTITAAVYFANAQYLCRLVNIDKERITLNTRTKKRNATHQTAGLYAHNIRLPHEEWFVSIKKILFALDAETRHAIHQNLQQDRGTDFNYTAQRSDLVISETIDEGKRPKPEDIEFMADPYINDYWMFDEEDGHAGAKYLARFLSPGPGSSKQLQLHWLSRLPLREKCNEETTKDLKKSCEELKEIEKKKSYNTKTTEVILTASPYEQNIEPLIRFYMGQQPTSAPEVKLFETRRIALKHPYLPADRIIIDGKEITSLASQLDYVALKLVTTKPVDLKINYSS